MQKLLLSNSFSTPVYVGMFLILTAIIGLVTNLAGVWGSAYLMDAPVLAENPTGGPGALLLAMFICSPIALVAGPVSGIVGGVISTYLAMRFKSEAALFHWVCGSVGAGLTGFVVGILPFAAIYFYDALSVST